MSPFTQRFFRDEYFATYLSTRDEIVARIHGILGNKALEKVFSAPANKFDMFDALQTGKIVVVNVPLAFLGDKGAQLFGRYMIASTLAAALERVTIHKVQRRPAFLHIDEFQEFSDDEKTPKILALAREFNLGVTMYTHLLAHFSLLMRSVVLTNTRTKYAARLADDAPAMAKIMGNCDPALLMRAPTDPHVQLACYVSGLSDAPSIIQLPKGAIDREPQLSEHDKEFLWQRNRERLPILVRRPTPPPPPPPNTSAYTPPPPPPPQPNSSKPAAPPRDEAKLRDRTGALDSDLLT
jgi:hypothetical protein